MSPYEKSMVGAITDEEIRELGFERTSKGWVPLAVANEHRRTSLTTKQWRRFSFVSTRGWLALPEWSTRTFALASCLGKMMHVDKSFRETHHRDEALCVVIPPFHRDRLLQLLGHADSDRLRPWRRAVKSWEDALMAHACETHTAVTFFDPSPTCPSCDSALPRRAEQPSHGGSSATPWLESVPTGGDAIRDGKGDAG